MGQPARVPAAVMTPGAGAVYDPRAVLPLGIPLGRQTDGRFAVRKGGRVFLLDALKEELWVDAHGGFDADTLAGRREDPTAPAAVYTLADAGLLHPLTAEAAADWPRLRPLRPLPRAIPLGYDRGTGRFVLAIPDTGGQLQLDPVAYCLWTEWDGLATLGSAVGSVTQAVGLSPSRVRERAMQLACLGVFTAACYLDAADDKE